MGVPAFFRWLSSKYPKIIIPAVEDDPVIVAETEVPAQYSAPNKNQELDNLYLDMNGIVHPCTHPEGRPAPETEDQMMLEVFRYTDRVVSLAKPRKVLMMAIDGVAPRAKMNQQRSRRFRSAQDAKLAQQAKEVDNEFQDQEVKKKTWDTNVITPGTPFMDLLATSLRFWVAHKMNTDPGWKDLHVIISDASVPGEGEHKIMDFIRGQRCDPQHDPNTSHCIYGLDADLIFLGLATHEPNFRVLREDVFQQNKQGQKGDRKSFIWLDISILRQYLQIELQVPVSGFSFDLERAIDDWVFMAFFCGNDFLPHLPSLDIRERGIDVLMKAWRRSLGTMQGYMTCDGDVEVQKMQIVLRNVATQEDDIFRQKRQQELRQEARRAGNNSAPRGPNKKLRPGEQTSQGIKIAKAGKGDTAPIAPLDNIPIYTPSGESVGVQMDNIELAAKRNEITLQNDTSRKRPADSLNDEASAADDSDNIRFHEPGYRSRYYEVKFGISEGDVQSVNHVVQKYVEGVCWVLKYYYQGCPSWTWYYPYHYAPFAADMTDLSGVVVKFEKGEPFSPFEQLMSVLPAASSHALPAVFRGLMSDKDSPILDFYPEDFAIDMNGKKMSWQGIALLPFIDEERLLKAVRAKYPLLTENETHRNARGVPILAVAPDNRCQADLIALYGEGSKESLHFASWYTKALAGDVMRLNDWEPHKCLICPVSPAHDFSDIETDRSAFVGYANPVLGTDKSMILQGYKPKNLVLTQSERNMIRGQRDSSNFYPPRRNRNNEPNFVAEQYSEPPPKNPFGYMGYLEQISRGGYNLQSNSAESHGFRRGYPDHSQNNGFPARNEHQPNRNPGWNSRGSHASAPHNGYQGYQGYRGGPRSN